MNLAYTDITTSAAKHRRGSHATSQEIITKSVPWLELDERHIDPDDAPRPCPASTITREQVVDITYITRQGVAVVIPSPWVDETVNRRAARFWYKHGFARRDWRNCEDITEGYIVEYVRMCDVPVRVEGKSVRYSAKAWLVWANEKYKELYHA